MGTWCYLVFYLSAAFVSSSFQLTAGGSTGIGASGVVYAIFGYLWYARNRFPEFQQVLHPQTISLFFCWLIFCVFTSVTGMWEVGNVAHFTGLIWGIMVASWVIRDRPRLAFAGLIVSAGMSVAVLFWAPWCFTWLGMKAYQAHIKGDLQTAIKWYDRALQVEPGNQWAIDSRNMAEASLQLPNRIDNISEE